MSSVCYGKEVIIMSGGSIEKYLNFGGSTLINWEMIRYAFENGYERYNFHGTIETDQITKAKGNYHSRKILEVTCRFCSEASLRM